jgi:hypothetical protein
VFALECVRLSSKHGRREKVATGKINLSAC